MLAKDLKKSVLQAAVQGKLVKQHDYEGNASYLIKLINEERQRLIQEKIIKSPKALPSITEEEILFDIPDNWRWVRINDVYDVVMGTSPKGDSVGEFLEGIEFHQGKVYFTDKYISYCPQKTIKPTRIAQPNDVLLSVRAPVGAVNITERKICIGRGLCALRPFLEKMNNRYLFYVLKAFENELVKKATGTTFVAVTGEVIKNQIIPLPPLGEQKRIVAKIEEVMKEIDEYEKVEKELYALKQAFPIDLKKSLLQAAIQGKLVEQHDSDGDVDELIESIKTEREYLIKEKIIKKSKKLASVTKEEIPFDIPDNWRWIRLNDVGEWGAGATPLKSKYEYYGGTMPWLKTGELTDGEITEHIECITELALKETSLRINKPGDVLIAMYGATIGKLGILTFKATTNQACCACTPFTGIYNRYLFYYLMAIREKFKAISEGGAQPNISKEKILRTLFPLPPFEEQKRIVEKLEQLLPLCDDLIKVQD